MTGLLAERLHQASDNAIAMWSAVARSRGDVVHEHASFTAVDGRRFRIMVRHPGVDVEELTALARARRADGRTVVVEDPFQVLDLAALGMKAAQLPVMVREPAPAPGPTETELVRTAADLRKAEDIIVNGFELEEYQPYEPGVTFPPALLESADLFLRRDHAGACLTMTHGGVGGVYWVTTLPEHRSKGVGREIMHAVLRHFQDLPVTLTASRAGRPLYEKLGFVTLGDSDWWR
ncbi:GNAT family N-acetyltransferase [Amycolatopsis sp. NEAU-NG30]|uniref:GNAT family N-acetyltransferase n=1 Tax=Amycolatopsis melonis TaxID=3156488 RepID=A0ABV0LI98_9PSEU